MIPLIHTVHHPPPPTDSTSSQALLSTVLSSLIQKQTNSYMAELSSLHQHQSDQAQALRTELRGVSEDLRSWVHQEVGRVRSEVREGLQS